MTGTTAKRWTRWAAVIAAAWLVGGATLGFGQLRARIMPGRGVPGPGGMVNLPYMVNDNKGQMWRIYQSGYLQNQGPTPNGGNTSTYSQAAVIAINGNNPSQNTNQGRVDDKTGELVIENLQGPNVQVTRRIFVDKDGGFVRYIDIIKNTQAQDQNVQLMISTNMNYGINTSQVVEDPKKKGQQIGWACQTGSMACCFEMYAGKGSKVTPTIMAQPGNSQCQASYQVTVPGNKEIAIMHLHGMVASQDAGIDFISKLRESALMKSIPREVRRLLVNFAGGQNFIGDFEVLRGDLLDVVELKSGDQLKGTLKEPAYDLTTFYGPVSLPVDRVIGVINVGQFRPRQLLVTTDGQVFGGKLKKETLDLQLTSGQVTQIPLSQVNRVGYRKRAGEPEEWTFEKPIVLMRTGERVGVKMPTSAVEVATRYGKLALKPDQIAGLVLQGEDNAGVHQVLLTDGSKFSGVLSADTFDMTLDAAGPEQAVKFPASSVARIQLTPKVAEVEDSTPTLKLANDDLLVGTVGGFINVDTSFDTIKVNTTEIKQLVHVAQSASDVQVTLWDGSTVSGQLQEMDVPVKLAGGVELKVPVALLEEYAQPQPKPSQEMVDKIKKVIEDLNSQDWKQRDRAQNALTQMGPVAISVLKELREGQPPEAQKRIDEILKDLEKQQKEKAKAGTASPAGGAAQPLPAPMIIDRFQVEG